MHIGLCNKGTVFIITEIHTSEHGKTNNTPEILEVFRAFYQELYKSRTRDQEGDMKNFFESINLPKLPDDEREILEKPLTLEELRDAVANLSNNKSPRSDGLPGEIYKTYEDVLLPDLLIVFNHA